MSKYIPLKFDSFRAATRTTFKGALLALGVAVVNTGPTLAGERVTFETPPVQPSAFKVKRAKAQGKTLEPTPGITLEGVLSVPDGKGPHPAIILLPERVEAYPSYQVWANHLTDEGFVTLLIQSLASRDVETLRLDRPMNLLEDVQGGHSFLSTLGFVDVQRIGLVGFGLSGEFVHRSLDASFTRRAENVSFYAGAALYPHCDPGMRLEAPILVLMGGSDSRASVSAYRSMIDLNRKTFQQSRIQVYPEATHFFDNIAYAKDPDLRGSDWVEPALFEGNDYSPEFRAEAEQAMVDFFNSSGAPD